MGNVGGGEILVILLVALIFLGPEKLPEVARQIGKVVGEVRKVTSGFQREMHDAMRLIDDAAKDTPAPATAVVEAAPHEAAPPEPAAGDAPVADAPVATEPPAANDAPDEMAQVGEADEVAQVIEVVASGTETTPGAPIVASEAPPLPLEPAIAPAAEAVVASTIEPAGIVPDPVPAPSAAPPLPIDTAHGGDR